MNNLEKILKEVKDLKSRKEAWEELIGDGPKGVGPKWLREVAKDVEDVAEKLAKINEELDYAERENQKV